MFAGRGQFGSHLALYTSQLVLGASPDFCFVLFVCCSKCNDHVQLTLERFSRSRSFSLDAPFRLHSLQTPLKAASALFDWLNVGFFLFM